MANHPASVSCSLAPLVPAGISLSTSVAFLNLLISAEAWGTLIPVALAISPTVDLPSDRNPKILLLFLLLIFDGDTDSSKFALNLESSDIIYHH